MTTIQPESGSRLDQLAARYAQLKPAADEATAALKAVTDAIKLELTTAGDGAPKVDLASEHLAKTLRLQHVESWRIDSTKLKAEAPEIYVRYAKKSGAWKLGPVSS